MNKNSLLIVTAREFGHEVAVNGVVRAQASGYPFVVVSTFPDRGDLYAGVADEFSPHGYRGACDVGRACDQQAWKAEVAQVRQRYPNADVWEPPSAMVYDTSHAKPFGERIDVLDNDLVLLHARGRTDFSAYYNWPLDKWAAAVEALRGMGMKCCCFGHSETSRLVPGCDDWRGTRLGTMVRLLNQARFAVGESSGGMHLAAWSKCPIVVWNGSHAGKWPAMRDRYHTDWNPFGTPVWMLDRSTWNPGVEEIIALSRQATELGSCSPLFCSMDVPHSELAMTTTQGQGCGNV